MKAKRLVALGLTAAMVGSLAGCGGSKSENGESEDGKIVITAISTQNEDKIESDPMVKTWYESWDRFLADHPNVELKHEYIPHDAYQEKAQILATGDELPDLFEMKSSWTENWANNGVVMDLNEVLEADPEWAGEINEGAYSAFEKDGSLYGLTLDGGGLTGLIFYNEDIFQKCGIEKFPENLDEFNDAIVKIKEAGYTPISLGNVANWPAESCIFSLIMSRVCGENWIQDLLKYDGSADFTNPDFVKALNVMKEWVNMGAFNEDVNSIDYTEARVPYYEEKAAMIMDGYWAVGSILSDATQDIIDKTKIAEIPIAKGDGDLDVYGGGGWAISVNSDMQEDQEKYELIKEWYKEYLCEESANTMYEMGKIPSVKTDGYDESKLQQLQIDYYEFFDQADEYTVIDLYFSPSLVDVLNTSLQELLIGQVEPEEIAERVQAEYEKSLN